MLASSRSLVIYPVYINQIANL